MSGNTSVKFNMKVMILLFFILGQTYQNNEFKNQNLLMSEVSKANMHRRKHALSQILEFFTG